MHEMFACRRHDFGTATRKITKSHDQRYMSIASFPQTSFYLFFSSLKTLRYSILTPILITLPYDDLIHTSLSHRSDNLNIFLRVGQNIAAMPFHREILAVSRSRQRRKLIVRRRVHDASDMRPVNRRRTHSTRFPSRIKRTLPQIFFRVMRISQSCQTRLCMVDLINGLVH